MTRRTVRFRLTAVYAGLFTATSVALVVTLNLMLKHNLNRNLERGAANDPGGTRAFTVLPAPTGPTGPASASPPPQGQQPSTAVVGRHIRQISAAVQRDQWVMTGVFVTALAVLSLLVGWWLAGRMLRPLHRVTSTARRLSLADLHERIALSGPHDELRELADTFDGMLERLQRASDVQRRFAANASHELRTPLTIQRTAIQVGLDDPSPGRLAQVRGELLAVNRRMEALIDGLLALGQGERGLDSAEKVPLEEVVGQAVAETSAKDIELHCELAPAVVLGDPVLLARLAANLLDNAVRHNRPGGTVDVRVTADGRLTVHNTGDEVPEERIGELFEPFRRLHTARTGSAGGVGLGLSIAAAIARAHRADLTASPNPGGGLRMTVRFPAAAGA